MTYIYQYPLETPRDYMMLKVIPYTPRSERNPTSIDIQREIPTGEAPYIDLFRLPFPDLPQMISQQKYGTISGALNNALASGLGNAYAAIDSAVTAGTTDAIDVGGIAERLKAQAQMGPVAREIAANAAILASGIVGLNAGMFQTLSTGEITNPNIELLYSGPSLRSYSFNFTFAPKSDTEALACYEIVRQLKRHHLPSTNGGSGMLKVPNLFMIDLYVNGELAKFYQKYFKCALESISVKQDSAGQHITLPKGEPIISSMSLVFREIEITTREMFEDNI